MPRADLTDILLVNRKVKQLYPVVVSLINIKSNASKRRIEHIFGKMITEIYEVIVFFNTIHTRLVVHLKGINILCLKAI